MPQLQESRNLLRKPSWLKVRLPYAQKCREIKNTLAELNLHTVCQEAACPNIAECFTNGTATFLIAGNICTRNCLYCNVRHGTPLAPAPNESERVTAAAKKMQLQYIVLTSVTRDDLPDGGGELFARCIGTLRSAMPLCKIEVLIPDFQGSRPALETVIAARPDVINHNMEVVKPLFAQLRPQGNYDVSLKLLEQAAASRIITKSGFMVGFGENRSDIVRLIEDLAAVSCTRLTIGQYQRPTMRHWPVAKYWHPDDFAEFREIAYQKGFQHVAAGPLVRSSYHAAQAEV